jgi:hypothetical protein
VPTTATWLGFRDTVPVRRNVGRRSARVTGDIVRPARLAERVREHDELTLDVGHVALDPVRVLVGLAGGDERRERDDETTQGSESHGDVRSHVARGGEAYFSKGYHPVTNLALAPSRGPRGV